MVTKSKFQDGRHLGFSIFEIFSKIERYYWKLIENIILSDKNVNRKKTKNNDVFTIFREKSAIFAENLTSGIFGDDVINDNLI